MVLTELISDTLLAPPSLIRSPPSYSLPLSDTSDDKFDTSGFTFKLVKSGLSLASLKLSLPPVCSTGTSEVVVIFEFNTVLEELDIS